MKYIWKNFANHRKVSKLSYLTELYHIISKFDKNTIVSQMKQLEIDVHNTFRTSYQIIPPNGNIVGKWSC